MRDQDQPDKTGAYGQDLVPGKLFNPEYPSETKRKESTHAGQYGRGCDTGKAEGCIDCPVGCEPDDAKEGCKVSRFCCRQFGR